MELEDTAKVSCLREGPTYWKGTGPFEGFQHNIYGK